MTIELPPTQSRQVSRLVKSGAYSSVTQVLVEGLKLLTASQTSRQKAEARVRHEVLDGVRQIRAGKVLLLDHVLVADIKARGRQRLAQSKLARRARGT